MTTVAAAAAVLDRTVGSDVVVVVVFGQTGALLRPLLGTRIGQFCDLDLNDVSKGVAVQVERVA